jgi:hypothetical protein
MYHGRFVLDPESGARVKLALEAHVDRSFRDGSGRSRDQRMADALVDLADFAATRDDRLGHGRRRPTLLVDVDYDVLLERAAGNGHAHTGDSIDPAALQRLMCDAGLHRVVTTGRSIIHDMGAKVGLAPEGLYLALVVRDRGCRWPGCDARASWCEVHHIVPRQHHGPTNQTNCVLLCSAHHTLTHDLHWQVRGTGLELHVTGPDGTTRTSRPPRAGPPATESPPCPTPPPRQLQLVS